MERMFKIIVHQFSLNVLYFHFVDIHVHLLTYIFLKEFFFVILIGFLYNIQKPLECLFTLT